MRQCAVVIPVYKAELDAMERFSLDYSLARLPGRDLFFVAPATLDLSYYVRHFPGVTVVRFDDSYFASIKGYNRLLLNPGFYQHFATHAFMLILQTDAILLKDDLDWWCAQPYDYVGAPWPDGLEIMVNVDVFGGANGKRVKTHVGNGGLSLRRNAKCISLLAEFPQATQMFLHTGSSEDIFFAIMGAQSTDFLMPNERVASRFALELKPEFYHAVNGGQPPMGGHAWWRYNQAFWEALLDEVPPVPSAMFKTLPEPLLEPSPAQPVALPG